ncbi:MAG: type II toxin-antitoxin system prevent-host-death family antitoxin [Planctomycetes bacterium]|nr:type II toxin-antitoxin system prevent-host-death family antitoxin [Planctomycetota bacterium]
MSVRIASVRISIRELREHLSSVLLEVSKGRQLVITRRGKPVARIVPEKQEGLPQASRYPLRGSVLRMSKDFDEPQG